MFINAWQSFVLLWKFNKLSQLITSPHIFFSFVSVLESCQRVLLDNKDGHTSILTVPLKPADCRRLSSSRRDTMKIYFMLLVFCSVVSPGRLKMKLFLLFCWMFDLFTLLQRDTFIFSSEAGNVPVFWQMSVPMKAGIFISKN